MGDKLSGLSRLTIALIVVLSLLTAAGAPVGSSMAQTATSDDATPTATPATADDPEQTPEEAEPTAEETDATPDEAEQTPEATPEEAEPTSEDAETTPESADEETATDAPTADEADSAETTEEATPETTAEAADAEETTETATPTEGDAATSTETTDAETETASFEVDAGADRSAQIGEAVEFSASASGASGAISYDWQFDDRGFASGQSAEHTYVEPGTYEATVTARDEDGTEATDTVSVTVERSFADAPTLEPGSSTMPPVERNSVYAVEVSEGQSIGVVTSGTDDGWVGLYSPSGELVDSTEIETADSTLFGATAAESGTYYVVERSSMVLELELRMGESDRFESNQDRSSAATLEGDAATGTLTEGDAADWYAVEAGSGTLDVSLDLVRHATNQGDAAVQIFDADGQQIGTVTGDASRTIANGVEGKFAAEQRARIDESGTYYVRVTEAGGSEPFTAVDGFTEYELSIDAPPASEDASGSTEAPDGSDTPDATETPAAGSATPDASDSTPAPDAAETPAPTDAAEEPLEPTETPESTGTDASVGDASDGDTSSDEGSSDAGDSVGEDGDSSESFSVSVGDDRSAAIGEELRFEADASGADDVNYQWIVRRDGSPVADAANATMTQAFNASGNYTVTVTARDGDGNEVSDTANVSVDGEFADLPTLASGETMDGEESIAFGVEVAAGQSLGVAVESGMEGTATIYAPSGEVVQTVSLHPDSTMFGATATESGTYRVTLSSPGFPSATPYVRDSDGGEPNQNASDAADIAAGESVTATLTENDSVDWYAVEAGAGTAEVSLNLSELAVNQGDVSLQIYDADVQPIGEVTPSDTTGETNRTYANGVYYRYSAVQRAQIDDPGVYYVRVSTAGDDRVFSDVDGFVEYDLTVNASAPADDAEAATETETSEQSEENFLSGTWFGGFDFRDLFALFGATG